jgi:hypothetical protein
MFLDIKPGSCPNALNVIPFELPPRNSKPKKGGVLPVAILGTLDLDVYSIDVSSVLLENIAPCRYSYEDVAAPPGNINECACTRDGSDGHSDLNLKFSKKDIVSALGSVFDGDIVPLTLTGRLCDGTTFQATDCITVRGPKTPAIDNTMNSGGGDSENSGLCPATPNPFNPVTRLSYFISCESFVNLSIFDVTGRLVEVLILQRQSRGDYSVEWNARGLPSGVYFYRLQTDDVMETRKLILLK